MKTQMTISEATQLIIDLCANHKDKACRDEAIATLDDLGYFSDQDSRGNSRFIQLFTESSVRYHLKKVIESYS